MQRNSLAMTIYRSLADSQLIIDDQQAVLTIIANPETPFQINLYIEILFDLGNHDFFANKEILSTKTDLTVLHIGHYSEEECNNRPRSLDKLDMIGRHPHISLSGASHNAVNVENKLCFIRSIPRTQAQSIAKYKNNLEAQRYTEFLKMKSLDFFRCMLLDTKVIQSENELKLFYLPKKCYTPTRASIKLWKKENGNHVNPHISFEIESKIADNLLPKPAGDKLYLNPKIHLQSLFKAHNDNTINIDWKSEEGRNIQFIQEKLGLYLFCYDSFIKSEIFKITPLIPELINIIAEYVDCEYNRIHRISLADEVVNDKVSFSKCIVM